MQRKIRARRSDSPAEELDSCRRRVPKETKTIQNTRSVRATASSRGFFVRNSTQYSARELSNLFDNILRERARHAIGSLTCLS